MKTVNRQHEKFSGQRGFSLPEITVVVLVLAILTVLALPQIMSSKRLFRFSGLQRQVTASLRDARQAAMSQRTPITVRYDDTAKRLITYGGGFGIKNDAKNLIYEMSGSGLEASEIRYGRPLGVSPTALSDSSNLTDLVDDAVEITFQPDGSVVDAGRNPVNKALFFYNSKHSQETAFAVSVLGAGGRVKVWRYSSGARVYVE